MFVRKQLKGILTCEAGHDIRKEILFIFPVKRIVETSIQYTPARLNRPSSFVTVPTTKLLSLAALKTTFKYGMAILLPSLIIPDTVTPELVCALTKKGSIKSKREINLYTIIFLPKAASQI